MPAPASPAASSASAPARFENHVRINKNVNDAWGIPALHIEVKDGDNERNMAKDAAEYHRGVVPRRRLGHHFEDRTFYPPGYSIHEVGTCRMGDNPKTSVLNKYNQSHDIKNLFVVDGAAFVTCGWQNPTMTILALSMRASEYLRRADEEAQYLSGARRSPCNLAWVVIQTPSDLVRISIYS